MVDMTTIREVHGLAQAAKESQRVETLENRVGTVLYKQGHRSGFWDGAEHVLTHLPEFAEYFDWRVFAGFTNGSLFARWLRAGDFVRVGLLEGTVLQVTPLPREGAVRFIVRTESGRTVECTRPANTEIRVLSLGAVT